MTGHPATTAKPKRSTAYLVELLRALVVTGLIFLNFAHAQAALADMPDHGMLSLCGDAETMGDSGAHGHDVPCHACRIGGAADLPPPPALPQRLTVGALSAGYAAYPQPFVPSAPRSQGNPRAPPAIV